MSNGEVVVKGVVKGDRHSLPIAGRGRMRRAPVRAGDGLIAGACDVTVGEMDDRSDRKFKLAPEVVDAIARRVVELLPRGTSAQVELVDAAELARQLGIERSWVYTHAIQLGAIKLGNGRRLRFDPQVAIERIRASARQNLDQKPRPRPRHPRPVEGERPPLLPIRGDGAVGATPR